MAKMHAGTTREPQEMMHLDEYEVDEFTNESGDAVGPVQHNKTTYSVKQPILAPANKFSPVRRGDDRERAGGGGIRTACLPDYFLWAMVAIFLFAFTSLFVQLRGLYGDQGVLPARHVLDAVNSAGGSLLDRLMRKSTLLLVMQDLKIRLDTSMTLLCLSGIAVASLCLISRSARHHFTFGYMWLVYLSMYQVGQTFLSFQWDILLLEAGLIATIIAPFPLLNLDEWNWATSDIRMWSVRWLLFRLMFSSGIVKLTSRCPTWWDLSALNYHYESQCIPTPGAWYIHNMPLWFTKLSLVFAMIAECVVPFAFFVRVAPIRWLSFAVQVVLQLGIIATGNYNFFNLLTIVLCLSLLAESDVGVVRERSPLPPFIGADAQAYIRANRDVLRLPKFLLGMATLSGLVAVVYTIFQFRIGDAAGALAPFDAAWKITPDMLVSYLPRIWTASVLIAAASFVWTVFTSLNKSLVGINFYSLYNTVTVLLFSLASFGLFTVSLLPYSSIIAVDQQHQVKPSPNVLSNEYRQFLLPYYQHAARFHAVNSYGLFRSMTGVGGRPELVIEGAYSRLGPWSPYEFQYKPGNISAPPPFLIPHQPRLDWQMWFAALGAYQHNPWLINLVYRLLQGEPSVYALLGPSAVNDKFALNPPTLVRISKFLYHYTSNNVSSPHYSKQDWWWRTPKGGYLEPLELNSTELVTFATKHGLERIQKEGQSEKSAVPVLDRFADSIQTLAASTRAEYIMLAVFIGSITLMWLLGRRR